MDVFDQPPALNPLTLRERDILGLVIEGLSNKEIAERLVISLGTTKWYLKQIYQKLGVSSRTQAIARANALGLLDIAPIPPRVTITRHNLPYQRTPFVGRTEELTT